MTDRFEDYLNHEQPELLSALTSPARIQAVLDAIPYSAEEVNRCPLRVLQDRKAHCYDGALFAAAALRRIGCPPIVVELLPEDGLDDDHLLAIYKRNGLFGAIAKSNFIGLRFREAIHRNLRELALSYFEDYYNISGQKTLRGYTVPLSLKAFDQLSWTWRDEGVEAIVQRLAEIRRIPLLPPKMAAELSPMDSRSYTAGLFGSDPDGLYQPGV